MIEVTSVFRRVQSLSVDRLSRLIVCACYALALMGGAVTVADPIDPATVERATADSETEMVRYEEVISGPNVTFGMVPVPGGEFWMGSDEGEEWRLDDEGPRVRVKVEPFWMGEHEVTWDEYEVFMLKLDIDLREKSGEAALGVDELADGVSRPTPPYADMTFDMGKGGYPAISMTNLAARKYTEWLSKKTGRFYRLPTEAEWEYAARAGSESAYSFGNDSQVLAEHGWFFDNANDQYQKVGQREPNVWGLYDMHGNVLEWCVDQYDPGRYGELAGNGVVGVMDAVVWPSAEHPRVVRGGSWYDYPEDLRSARRRGSEALWKKQDPQEPKSVWYLTDAMWVGFRVVRPLVEPSEEEKARFWEAMGERERGILERQRLR